MKQAYDGVVEQEVSDVGVTLPSSDQAKPLIHEGKSDTRHDGGRRGCQRRPCKVNSYFHDQINQ